jgi:mono/diheme cytochrome c family protein
VRKALGSRRGVRLLTSTLITAGLAILTASAYLEAGPQVAPSVQPAATASPEQEILNRYCITCHNERLKTGGLMLDALDVKDIAAGAPTWEKVVRKLRAGVMPPAGARRPDEPTQDKFVAWLEGELDRAAAARPNPGRTETFHRLNRAEYRNVIRDLLAIDIDVADFLPADDSSYGFDNIAGVLKVSQSLMERYLSAAKTISRLAVGAPLPAVDSETYRVAPEAQQHDRADGLPFGTRGGMLVHHLFPQDGEYEIKLEVGGGRGGAREPHEIEIAIDGQQFKLIAMGRPPQRGGGDGDPREDSRLTVRLPVTAGPHELAVAFLRKPVALLEQVREPFQNPRISGNDGGPGGSMPSLTSVNIRGPYNPQGAGNTPSRHRIFVCQPSRSGDEARCAKTILSTLARRAYRGPVADADVQVLLGFYQQARDEGGNFESGIELALRRLLVSPEFLFRIEADPNRGAARALPVASNPPGRASEPGQGVYRINDLELASRLSFFLWSSIPDDELLDLAMKSRLNDRAVLVQQVKRMLADPRSESLTKNFAGQWLQLRNMSVVRPGDPYSLTFDESLRLGLTRETELFFDSILRENRSVIEMLTADYTFLNERVALHYGIPNVQGSHFRRITLPADSPRRGILGHGSILTMTSHAIRTSPVIRGKWVLNNILGTPPPEPPPNVPALVDKKTQAKTATMRERMAQHRASPSCSACHNLIDPAGFALENFDAIGRWREVDESFNRIDASGVLPDGTKFNGAAELRAALVRRPERFVTTVSEKLLTYALGRGLEYYDMPAVRKIVRESRASSYKLQDIIRGVVKSDPFQMRQTEAGRLRAAAQ